MNRLHIYPTSRALRYISQQQKTQEGFFAKSDALFKFFEELSAENVGFDTLHEADAYAEFGKHLEILEKLLVNYKKLLDEKGFSGKAFVSGCAENKRCQF